MNTCAVVFADRNPDDWSWYCVAKAQIRQSGYGLTDLRETADFSRLVALIPGELTGARQLQLAGRNIKDMQDEALFSVEEHIGTEIEAIHGSLAADADEEGKRAFIWIAIQDMQEFLHVLKENGLEADRMIPDYLAVPQDDALTPVMTKVGDRILLRHKEIGATLLTNMTAIDPSDAIEALFDSQTAIDPFDEYMNQEEKIAAMAIEAAQNSATQTLLQGRFSKHYTGFSRLLKPARMLGICAFTTLLLFAALQRLEGQAFRTESLRLQKSTEMALRSAFPDIGRITNPWAQLQARMQNHDGRTDFLRLSALLRESLQSVSGIELESLRFDDSGQGLQAQVRFSRYEDMTSLRQSIEASGGQFEERGSSQAENGRIGDIVVKIQ